MLAPWRWLSLAAVLLVAGTAPSPVSAQEKKPNFVLILIDDLGYGDIAPFGSKINPTPHLEKLAKEGMKLTSFYACPVCTPSRAQIMTGCYAKRVSLPGVLFPAAAVGLNPQEATVAQLLKRLGYATMCVGKWHLGDQPKFLPTHYGFDHYFGLPYSNDMGPAKNADPKKAVRPPLPLVRDDKVIETVSPEGQDALTERYTDEAVKFIRTNKDRPFFLYLPHTAIHGPLHPGKAYRGTTKHGTYSDWVAETDASVGRVVDTLRDLKLADNTLVVFTSDNGATKMGSNAPLSGFKASVSEGGMRVPTIAWWPGKIQPGTESGAVTGNIDLLPTFVKLAGGEVPRERVIDGKDLWPILSGKSKESPHDAYYCFGGTNLKAVRSGQWKYYLDDGKLINLDKDIGEKNDVSAMHADIIQKMKTYVERMEKDLGNAKKQGPGVRPPARVDNPLPLLLKAPG